MRRSMQPTRLFRAATTAHLPFSTLSPSILPPLSESLAAALGPRVSSSTGLATLDRTFTAAFGVLGGATGSGDPWADWVHSFYRRPHPELLPAALLHALRDQGGAPLRGLEALPTSAFLASAVFRRCCATEADVVGVLGACAGAVAEALPGAGADAGAAAAAEAALDTVLRAAWLAQLPACDAVLAEFAAGRAEAVRAAFAGAEAGTPPPPGGAPREELLAAAASLFPPAPLRRRAPLLQWPLPAADLAAFEAHAREEAFPLYGASALWGARLRALRAAAGGGARGRAAAALLAPPLAQAVSINMVEAYWAHFCATGDAAGVVRRVCDAAAGYGEFLDEFGLEPALGGAGGDVGAGAGVPPALRDDPLAALRFAASRFALSSLLAHAGRHTAVGDAFAAALAALNDEAVARDPLTAAGVDGGLTAFGERRLRVMHAARPHMAELAAEAWATGVGSGAWPESYALLHGEQPPPRSEAAAGAQPHAGAPALHSSPLDGAVEEGEGAARAGASGGGGFAAQPAEAHRGERPAGAQRRLSLRPERR
jgi:hypothetical protein